MPGDGERHEAHCVCHSSMRYTRRPLRTCSKHASDLALRETSEAGDPSLMAGPVVFAKQLHSITTVIGAGGGRGLVKNKRLI